MAATFDLGNVLAQAEAIKGARSRNALAQMDLDQRQSINALVRDPSSTPEQFIRAGDTQTGSALMGVQQSQRQTALASGAMQSKQLASAATSVLRAPAPKAFAEQQFPQFVQDFEAQHGPGTWAQLSDEQVRSLATGVRAHALAQTGEMPSAPIAAQPGTTFLDPDTRQPISSLPGRVSWEDTGGEKTPVDSVSGMQRTDIAPLKKTPTPYQTQAMTGAESLSSEGVEMAAQRYLLEGKLPTGLGRGASVTNAKILSRAAQISADNGEDARSAVLNRYAFQATQKAQAATLQDFSKGKNGNTVRSLNVAVQHLDQLQQLGTALNNGDVPLLNKLGNAWQKQTGGAAPVSFDAMKKVVTDELVKAIVGAGGGVADREEMAATVNAAQSPAQLSDVIANYKGLMAGQLNGLRQQYGEGTGRDDFERFLLPVTRAELEQHSARAPGAAGTAAKPPVLPPTNAKGWALHADKNGKQAYVSPDGRQFEEVR